MSSINKRSLLVQKPQAYLDIKKILNKKIKTYNNEIKFKISE